MITLDRRMYAVAMAVLRDSDDAADTVQETMVTLWESRNRLDSIENLDAYCLTAVRRKCLDRLKSFHQNRFVEMTDSIESSETAPDPSAEMESRQELHRAMKLIDRLPEGQRRVLTLSTFNSLSNSEIAAITRLTEQNVRTLLCRARQRVKQLYLQELQGLSPC